MTESVPMYGITLGSSASVVTDSTGEIIRNELGGHSSATLVAFTSEGRQLGEAAVMGMTANAKGTATEVGRLALIPYETLTTGTAELTSRHWQFAHEADADGALVMGDVALADGSTCSVPAVGLLGALLGKFRANSQAPEGTAVAIALPAVGSDAAAASRASSMLSDAAAIGGWKLVATPTATSALATALARKWPFAPADEGGADKHVLVLDMGAQTTTASVIRLTPPSPPAEKGGAAGAATGTVVAEEGDAFLGASLFNEALFDHFAAKVQEQYGEPVAPASKRGLRLTTAIERLRKLLSTMGEAAATAENLIDGVDVPLKLSRDELATLCAAPLERLGALLRRLLGSPARPQQCSRRTAQRS